MATQFLKARPVWVQGMEKEPNYRVQFKAICDRYDDAEIRIATSGTYQLWVNGEFVSYGPARAGKDHFRMEKIDISRLLNKDKNTVIIEAAGYYCYSFYIMRQPSFLQAEIVSNGEAKVFTGRDFTARKNPYYIQKIQRYSYQRTFAESYNLSCPNDSFFIDDKDGNEVLAETEEKKIIERKTPYPRFERITAKPILSGSIKRQIPKEYSYDRYILNVGLGEEENTGWKIDELDFFPEKEHQELCFTADSEPGKEKISAFRYNAYEFDHNATGIISFSIECEEDTTICVTFDELMLDDNVNPYRHEIGNHVCDVMFFNLSAGKHNIKAFEVYTMKYLQVAVLKGAAKVGNIELIEYKNPFNTLPQYKDEEIQKIVTAAVETYRQNTVDLYTDCPSRERAGYLCDSFFTARTEYALTGKNVVEESFLENFLHEDDFDRLPKRMLPMCYPASQVESIYIPNWAMWFVVELRDFVKRTGKDEFSNRFKKKIYNLLEYFSEFENSDGLLENLDGWVFVEWSRANDEDLINGINFPSNMMYYLALKCAGELYKDESLIKKSEALKAVILEQSYNGEFFCDNANPNSDSTLPMITEVCQYYAFFTGIATPETHKELFDKLLKDFGPERDASVCYPEVAPAAPFIGFYLRLQILIDYGYKEEVVKNIKGYFIGMVEKTGTLWEYMNTRASCNHGFASCVIYWLKECEDLIN